MFLGSTLTHKIHIYDLIKRLKVKYLRFALPRCLGWDFDKKYAYVSKYTPQPLSRAFIYLKCILFYFDMSITFCFGVSSNSSQEKSPTAEILGKYFLRTIVPRKYMGKISTVGLFSCDKFEETPKQKVNFFLL